MADGSNWEALGHTLASTLDAGILQGDLNQAMMILGNDENYLGSTWQAVKEEEDAEIEVVIAPVISAEERAAELLEAARVQYDAWKAT